MPTEAPPELKTMLTSALDLGLSEAVWHGYVSRGPLPESKSI